MVLVEGKWETTLSDQTTNPKHQLEAISELNGMSLVLPITFEGDLPCV